MVFALWHSAGWLTTWLTPALSQVGPVAGSGASMGALAPPGPAPFWRNWTLEEPGTLVFALAVVGLVLLLVARARGDRRYIAAACGAAALAVGVYGLSEMVTTDRERVIGWSRAFVAAASDRQTDAMQAMSDPELFLSAEDGGRRLDYAAVFDRYRMLTDRYDIESHHARVLGAELVDEDEAVVHVQVTTLLGEPAMGRKSVTTSWLFVWRRGGRADAGEEAARRDDDGVWRLTRLHWRAIADQRPTLDMIGQ